MFQKQPPEVFYKKRCCARVSFLIKLQAACNFIKNETLSQCFPVNFAKFLRALFSQNTSGRLLLMFVAKNVNVKEYYVIFMGHLKITASASASASASSSAFRKSYFQFTGKFFEKTEHLCPIRLCFVTSANLLFLTLKS